MSVVGPFVPCVVNAGAAFSGIIRRETSQVVNIHFHPYTVSTCAGMPMCRFGGYQMSADLFLSLFTSFGSRQLTRGRSRVRQLGCVRRCLLKGLGYLGGVSGRFVCITRCVQVAGNVIPIGRLLSGIYLDRHRFRERFGGLAKVAPGVFDDVAQFSLSRGCLELRPGRDLFSITLSYKCCSRDRLVHRFGHFKNTSPRTLVSGLCAVSPLFPCCLYAPGGIWEL